MWNRYEEDDCADVEVPESFLAEEVPVAGVADGVGIIITQAKNTPPKQFYIEKCDKSRGYMRGCGDCNTCTSTTYRRLPSTI